MSRFVFGGRSLDGDTKNIKFELRGRGWVRGPRGGCGVVLDAFAGWFLSRRGVVAGWLRGGCGVVAAKACDTTCVQIAGWLRDESRFFSVRGIGDSNFDVTYSRA